jgi:hypothetical protein
MVTEAFKSVTDSPTIVSDGNVAVATQLDPTPTLQPLYDAVSTAYGSTITTGAQLLAVLGNNPSAAVIAAVEATAPTVSAELTSALTAAGTAADGMKAAFDIVAESSAAAVQDALGTVTGGNTVSLINSTNPCVKALMNQTIDNTKVDQNALSLSTGLQQKVISLPAQESVTAANMTAPVTLNSEVNKPVVPAANMAGAPIAGPTIVTYDHATLNNFRLQLNQQNDILNAQNSTNAIWYKDNVEDWKQLNQYNAKKTAAGASVQNPYGTSTDPVILASWKAVYDAYIPLRDYFNETLQPLSVAERKKFTDMRLEYIARSKYGTNPYTYQIAQGIAIPEDQQFTLFIPTQPK